MNRLIIMLCCFSLFSCATKGKFVLTGEYIKTILMAQDDEMYLIPAGVLKVAAINNNALIKETLKAQAYSEFLKKQLILADSDLNQCTIKLSSCRETNCD